MASNERKIHPALSLSSLSASIYLSSLAALLHHTPTPSFLIRQIPRELGAISAAGTGVTCVCVRLCDLGACVCLTACVRCVRVCVCAEAVERAPGWGG